MCFSGWVNCDLVKTAERIFGDNKMNHTQKWEYFKLKIRELAIRHSKEIKHYIAIEMSIMDELNTLTVKEIKLKRLKEDIDNILKWLKGPSYGLEQNGWNKGKETQATSLP